MIVVESAGLTHVGQKRKGNEDSLFLDDSLLLYVVADGMGGHRAGEVASSLVVETMHGYLRQFALPGDVDEPFDVDESVSKEANRLLFGISLANRTVFDIAQQNEEYEGMGSTVSAVYLTENTLIAGNVGDSPIYLIRDGQIEPLYQPHTVLAEQIKIDPEMAERLGERYKHMLTRAMGLDEEVVPDICEIQCYQGDVLVICSDGLSDKASPEEIMEVAAKGNIDKACKRLVDLANHRGGDDNITVIVIRIKRVGGEGIKGLFSRIFG